MAHRIQARDLWTTIRVHRRSIIVLVALWVSGCATRRDTRLDHRLPLEPRPVLDLSRYESVQQRSDGQTPTLAVAAAISGGGHRAGNFAIGVMRALEDFAHADSTNDILREIDYFSTVSGGGFAAGTYIASLHDHLATTGGHREGYSLAQALQADGRRLRKHLIRDYQSTIFGSLFCVRCLGTMDAGDLFERKIDRQVLGSAQRHNRRSLTLGDVYRARGSGLPVTLPYWAANATVYENGVRFPFTPDVLEQYRVTTYSHLLRMHQLSDDPFGMPLAVGAKASASFPVAFPATTLGCDAAADPLNPYLHLMDGGLADNMGYRTAIDFLRQDRAPHKVLLIIDAYKGNAHPRSSDARSPSSADAAYRIMKISLDADHGKMDRELERLIQLASRDTDAEPISVITLSFDELKPMLKAHVERLKAELAALRRQRSQAVSRRIRRQLDAILQRQDEQLQSAENAYDLYDDARAIGTSLNITLGEQQLLFEAGAAAVRQQADRIADLILPHLHAAQQPSVAADPSATQHAGP
ncbi:MAG: patatin-like phospholipase family protein [Verrucomicrobia bacterium]|nr:patatin-like phospholipase family protein [Verrucomicrobiota bacterium]